MAYTVRITLRYVIIAKLFGKRKKSLKTISFYQKISHMGTHMLRALMLEKKKKKLKNMGTNMLLSWKTHFFEPSAHF